MKDNMSPEERDILESFERDELASVPDVDRQIELARLAARNTFNKTKRVNLRVTERDFNLAHARAREERNTLSDATVKRHPQVPLRPVD